MSNTFDLEAFKAIEQLKAGVPLSGKDGVLAPLLENLLNRKEDPVHKGRQGFVCISIAFGFKVD